MDNKYFELGANEQPLQHQRPLLPREYQLYTAFQL